MSSSIDRALMEMSLEEEEVPFNLPDLPQYNSCEQNSLSLIGRILNPDSQKVSDVILDMPRKWQLYDRVRGVALSKERFQFFFKYEHDLEEILKKGVHTFNQWALAMEKWVEKPPEDFLRYIQLWVQVRNIPVNHYTVAAIKDLGGFAGEVIEVGLDSTKAQTKDYVRVKLRFDVSKTLRRSKEVNLPSGDVVSILYDYERIQKRCYTCQRITHEQEECLIFLRKRHVVHEKDSYNATNEFLSDKFVFKADDPISGVNHVSGSSKISHEALEGMRQYLMLVSESELSKSKIRGNTPCDSLEKDRTAQNLVISLESAPMDSKAVDKGKGNVIDVISRGSVSQANVMNVNQKLLSSAIQTGLSTSGLSWDEGMQDEGMGDKFQNKLWGLQKVSKIYRPDFSAASSSGTQPEKPVPVKRTYKSRRKPKDFMDVSSSKDKGIERTVVEKRKAPEHSESSSKTAKFENHGMVPKEGLSNL